MDELEFRRVLDLFPIIRSSDYNADLEASRQSTSHAAQNVEVKEWQDAWDEGNKMETQIQKIEQSDAFWEKLWLAAEKKVGAAEAERFCGEFQRMHKKLVYEELNLNAAQKFINSSKFSKE